MLHAILHGAPDCRAPGGANGLSVDFQNDACIPEGFQFQAFVGGQYAPQGADRLVEVDVGVDQVVAPYFRGQEIPFTDVVFRCRSNLSSWICRPPTLYALSCTTIVIFRLST